MREYRRPFVFKPFVIIASNKGSKVLYLQVKSNGYSATRRSSTQTLRKAKLRNNKMSMIHRSALYSVQAKL